MEKFLSIEPTYLVLYVFLLILLLSFIVMLVCGDNDDKTYQKIIGGLSVFIVALISKNFGIIFASLFIGGLMIASEKFLKALAAILKTDSATMPKTLAALGQVELSHASEEEIKEEKNKEVVETLPISGSGRLSILEIEQIEKKVLKILSDKYIACFTPNLKLENKYGQLVVDGVIHHSSDSGKLNLDNVLTLVEIKYIHQPTNNFFFESTVRRVLERVRYLLVSKQVMVVFCAKNLTLEMANNIYPRLESIFSKDPDHDDVIFGFINLDQNLNPQVLMLGDLKPNVVQK